MLLTPVQTTSDRKPLTVVWDHSLERPTLGGALTLRVETEMRAHELGVSSVQLLQPKASESPKLVEKLRQTVFGTSTCTFADASDLTEECWPSENERRETGFSYYSLSRVKRLTSPHRLKPHLKWSPNLSAWAERFIARVGGSIVCLHLKRVAPYAESESNANPATWLPVVNKWITESNHTYLLLGDDPEVPGLPVHPRLLRAASFGLTLEQQLALISSAKAFIGTASGLCSAAMFSPTPYVIFKDSDHHVQDMDRDLPAGTILPFSSAEQKFVRCRLTPQLLESYTTDLLYDHKTILR